MTAAAHDHDLSRLSAVSHWLRYANAARAVNAARQHRSDATRLDGMVRENVHASGLVAAFTQGMAVGALIKGLPIAIGRYTGGEFGWFSTFAVL